MIDAHLEEQLVNELRDRLGQMNKKYKGYFHFEVLTLVDMKEDSCLPCTDDPFKPKCLRAVIGFDKQDSPDQDSPDQDSPEDTDERITD